MNTNIQKIAKGNQIYAIVIRQSLPQEGYNFISDDKDSLQVGVNHYAANTTNKPHFHLPLERALQDTLEVLHIDFGKCLLYIYDENQTRFFDTEIQTGDTLILLKGGHSLKILEKTKIIEVKQGPYLGPQKDKVVFHDPSL
jgi:hypothetical protein